MKETKNKNSKIKKMGQSIAEYSILISVIAAALLAMQIYMKRGIQSAVKYSADQFGNQADWIETDPDKATQQENTMQSFSDASMRRQEEVIDGRAVITTTTSENSTNTGTTTSWKEDEL